MKKFNAFLESRFYLLSISLYSLLLWSTRFFVPPDFLFTITLILLTLPSVLFFIICFTKKDVKYTIPIVLYFVFSIGVTDLNLDTISQLGLGFISVFFILAGIITHLIKYKIKVRLNVLGVSFILIVFSFFIPLTYRPITSEAILIPSISIIYLIIYLFYSNTKIDDGINYLFKVFSYASIVLISQVFLIFAYSFLIVGMPISSIWQIDVNLPGWGSFNDIAIQLILMSSAWIYFIISTPKKIIPWVMIILSGWVILLMNSRLSMIGFTFVLLFLLYHFRKSKFAIFLVGTGTIVVFCLILIFAPQVQNLILYVFSRYFTGGADVLLSGRIQLWQAALRVFEQFPVFGSGWYTELFFLAEHENRITIYHSTFFQVLATGGIFGIVVLIYHWAKVGQIYVSSKKNIAVRPMFIMFLVTSVQGLIDNTQYMLAFTFTTLFMFIVTEKLNSQQNSLEFDVEYNK